MVEVVQLAQLAMAPAQGKQLVRLTKNPGMQVEQLRAVQKRQLSEQARHRWLEVL
jgi:hypothetical protein